MRKAFIVGPGPIKHTSSCWAGHACTVGIITVVAALLDVELIAYLFEGEASQTFAMP
jgi:hypothetical protein